MVNSPTLRRHSSVVVLPYVVIVLGLDYFCDFRWLLFDSFDCFKFIFWLVIPLCLTLGDWDLSYYGLKRWRGIDFLILFWVLLASLGAVAGMRFFPSLAAYYPLHEGAARSEKIQFLKTDFLWNLSWLPGWEFLIRYYLLRSAVKDLPKLALFLIPLIEGAYHLHKPMPEMAGMVLLSFVLTFWAIRRKNGLLPLLVHAGIELGLALSLL
jgi:hypothetical protein